MKKLFLLPLAALALTACTSDEYTGTDVAGVGTREITFASSNGTLLKGADLNHDESAEALGKNFVVVGYKGSETTAANTGLVFDHYNVNYVDGTANSTTSNTTDWEYVNQDMKVKGTNPAAALATTATAQTIKYWDHAAASYDFIAFSMGKGYGATPTYATPTAVDKAHIADAAYTLTGDANTLSECYISDITTVKEPAYGTAPVMMKFRHLTSKVRLALFETVPGYVIKEVKFRETLTTSHAAATSANGILIGADAFNEKGKLTVYFPTTGTAKEGNSDYNKAHVEFAADATAGTSSAKTFGAVDYKNEAEDVITAGTTYLAQTAVTPSYIKPATGNAGEYTKVLPHENDSKVLSIQIDYTLVSTDGTGEEIKVYGARADVPAAYTAWKSGYAYTYKFKISQNTNGHTGTHIDDKGLTAITFDAVVIDDEANGIQETITTVATPSITTYGYIASSNIVSVNQNEYAAGTDIYATAQDGATAAAATALYTVRIGTDAAQGINEATVANCIAHGTVSGNDHTVLDANSAKMIVTKVTSGFSTVSTVPTSASTTLTIDALMWRAQANTCYAVEYTDGSGNKYYKVINLKAYSPEAALNTSVTVSVDDMTSGDSCPFGICDPDCDCSSCVCSDPMWDPFEGDPCTCN